jgi:hypothetical protein
MTSGTSKGPTRRELELRDAEARERRALRIIDGFFSLARTVVRAGAIVTSVWIVGTALADVL